MYITDIRGDFNVVLVSESHDITRSSLVRWRGGNVAVLYVYNSHCLCVGNLPVANQRIIPINGYTIGSTSMDITWIPYSRCSDWLVLYKDMVVVQCLEHPVRPRMRAITTPVFCPVFPGVTTEYYSLV